MMSSILLSLSTQKKKKKSNLQILQVTFCKYFFFNLKNRNGLQNNYFYF